MILLSLYDPIVAEVRRNREEMLAEFGGDIALMLDNFASKRAEMEAAGLRYITDEEHQARLAWKREREEAEERTVLRNLSTS